MWQQLFADVNWIRVCAMGLLKGIMDILFHIFKYQEAELLKCSGVYFPLHIHILTKNAYSTYKDIFLRNEEKVRRKFFSFTFSYFVCIFLCFNLPS